MRTKVPNKSPGELAKILAISLLALLVAPFASVVRYVASGPPREVFGCIFSFVFGPGLVLLWLFDVYGSEDDVENAAEMSQGAIIILTAVTIAYWVWLVTMIIAIITIRQHV